MGYRFRIHKAAQRQLEKLPGGVDDRILNKIEEMVSNEFRDLLDYDVRRIAGTENTIYRARIGQYRVFFVIADELVAILHVEKRNGAYRDVSKIDDRADEFTDS